MEKDFNPIKDLRSPEVDPFNVPAGQSTQEIEDIRLTLVVTREKTENLVKLLKRNGLLFKKDVEKIKELQRRLRKTIPRIPILRDDSISGSEISMDGSRRSRFDVMKGFNRPPKTPTPTSVPVANPFPFFEIAVAIIGIFGIKGIKMPKFLKNLFGKGKGAPNTIDDILKQLDDQIKGRPITIDDILKKINEQIKELEKAKKVVPTNLKNLQKNLKFAQQNQNTASRMSAAFDKNKTEIISGKKFANRKRQQEFLKKKQQQDIDKQFAKTTESTLDDFLKKNNLPDPFRLKRDAVDIYNAGRQDLLIMKSRKVNPISQSSFEKAMKALQSRLNETNRQISEYARAIQEASKGKGKVDLQNLDLFKSIERPIDPTKQTFEGTKRTLDEIIKSKNLRFDEIIENLFYQPPKSGAFLNTKPMSNDIAMLNTDTRDRETIVILTDSIA